MLDRKVISNFKALFAGSRELDFNLTNCQPGNNSFRLILQIYLANVEGIFVLPEDKTRFEALHWGDTESSY
jgi:hypothetical protein